METRRYGDGNGMPGNGMGLDTVARRSGKRRGRRKSSDFRGLIGCCGVVVMGRVRIEVFL